MARVPPLRIPPDFIAVAQALGALDAQRFDAAVEVLERDRDRVERGELLTDLESAAGWERGLAVSLLEMILSLRTVFQADNTNLKEVAAAIAASPDIPDEVDRRRLEEDLARLLMAKSTDLLWRAGDLITAHEHLLSDVRILTDIRPLFPLDDVDRIEGVLIGHVLRLELTGEEPAHLDIGLDQADLVRLKQIIDRAVGKEAKLRALVHETRVPLVVPYELNADD